VPRHRTLFALVCCVLALSGCASILDVREDREAVTPVPVAGSGTDGRAGAVSATGTPESGSTATESAVAATDRPGPPPGVRDGRLVEPRTLLAAHASLTANDSYTAHRSRVERFADGAVRSRSLVTARQARDGRYRVRVESTSTIGDSTEYWFDGQNAYMAAVFPNRTRYAPAYTGHGSAPLVGDLLYLESAPYRGGVASRRGLHRYVVAAGESTVTARGPAADGTRTVYTIDTRVDGTPQFAAREGLDSVENGSLSLTIDDRGLVRSYDLAYVGRIDGRRVSVTESVVYTNVSTTTVTGPAWPWLLGGTAS
jgi:uncharacterized protein YceK